MNDIRFVSLIIIYLNDNFNFKIKLTMTQFSNSQERDAFAEDVFELIQENLNDGSSEINSYLCVNPKTLEIAIFKLDEKPKRWDSYQIEKLIRPNENKSGYEPDCDATHELASSYCFVR